MRRGLFVAMTAAVVLVLAPTAAGAGERAADRLDVDPAVVKAGQQDALTGKGYDVTSSRAVAGGVELQLILTKGQRATLARDGVATTLTRVQGGKTVKEFAAAQSAFG